MSTENDGWIDNDGMPPRVEGRRIDLRFRNGLVQKNVTDPLGYRWTDTGHAYDIVAYRMVQP